VSAESWDLSGPIPRFQSCLVFAEFAPSTGSKQFDLTPESRCPAAKKNCVIFIRPTGSAPRKGLPMGISELSS
jgi:hypothetical protein